MCLKVAIYSFVTNVLYISVHTQQSFTPAKNLLFKTISKDKQKQILSSYVTSSDSRWNTKSSLYLE